MLSKRFESTEIDRRTWLHVPSGTHWSTSSDTPQVVEIKNELKKNGKKDDLVYDPKITVNSKVGLTYLKTPRWRSS